MTVIAIEMLNPTYVLNEGSLLNKNEVIGFTRYTIAPIRLASKAIIVVRYLGFVYRVIIEKVITTMYISAKL